MTLPGIWSCKLPEFYNELLALKRVPLACMPVLIYSIDAAVWIILVKHKLIINTETGVMIKILFQLSVFRTTAVGSIVSKIRMQLQVK